MAKKAKKLLIVDQNASRRDTLASRFRSQQNYEVEIASGSFQALSFSEKTLFHTIIIIGEQQEMSVQELVSMIRNLYSKKEVQILYSDKNKLPDEILEFFGLGLNEYIIYDDKVFGTLLGKVEMFETVKSIDGPRNSMLAD